MAQGDVPANAHHSFPSRFPPMAFAKAALITISYFVLIARSGFGKFLKRWLTGFGIGVLLFMLIGTVLTEVAPIRIVIQIQFYRSFMFMVILTLVLWAGLVLEKKDRIIYLLSHSHFGAVFIWRVE
ncbi:MAG: hypothetical protein U5L96_15605 [Owenweeksia sp.]|nr:hypothetical protein [Owenweeksia sp.]